MALLQNLRLFLPESILSATVLILFIADFFTTKQKKALGESPEGESPSGESPSAWTLDLTVPGGKISPSSTGMAQCTVTVSVNDLADMVEKKLNPQMAFMSGKLKVSGDMGLALKLGNIL